MQLTFVPAVEVATLLQIHMDWLLFEFTDRRPPSSLALFRDHWALIRL